METSRPERFALAPLILLLILFVWLVYQSDRNQRPGNMMDVDFGVYYSAAQVIRHGGNPYDHLELLTAEGRTVGVPVKRLAHPDRDRVGEPPVYFWLLQPMTRLPFRLAAYLMDACLAALAIIGMVGITRYLGWRRPVVPVSVALSLPPAVLYVHYGNIGAAVFGAVGLGLWLSSRHPALAGSVLSMALWKPQIALPLAALIILFHTSSRRAAIAGFVTGGFGLLTVCTVTTGPHSILWWLTGFVSFSGSIPTQGDIPSLAGLYVQLAPRPLHLLLAGTTLGAACILTASVFWRLRATSTPVSVRSIAWLWLVWFLAAPYGHMYDEVFLAPVLFALFGTKSSQDRVIGIALLYGTLFSIFIEDRYPGHVCLLCVVPAMGLISIILSRPGRRCPHQRDVSLLAPLPERTAMRERAGGA